MTETHQPTVTTHTIGEGEDTINYDVYGDLSAATPDRPALLAFANPMEAAAFAALAAEIQDRPVVTMDPRGAVLDLGGERGEGGCLHRVGEG